MGQLTNQYVSSSYQGLLKMTDSTTGVTGTLQTVQTGDGTDTPLQISQTQINISGSFTVNGSPVTGSAIDTGSFATTGSNTFQGGQTIVGNVTFPSSSFISTTNESGALYLSSLNGGFIGLNTDGGEGDVNVGYNGWNGKLKVTGSIDITGQYFINGVAISGSNISGFATTGSNRFDGDQRITGAIFMAEDNSVVFKSGSNTSGISVSDGGSNISMRYDNLSFNSPNGEMGMSSRDNLNIGSTNGTIVYSTQNGQVSYFGPNGIFVNNSDNSSNTHIYTEPSGSGKSNVVSNSDLTIKAGNSGTNRMDLNGDLYINNVQYTTGSIGSSGTSGSSGSDGTSGSNGTNGTSGTSGDSIFAQTGSVWNTTRNLGVTGSLYVSSSVQKDVIVDGQIWVSSSLVAATTSTTQPQVNVAGYRSATRRGTSQLSPGQIGLYQSSSVTGEGQVTISPSAGITMFNQNSIESQIYGQGVDSDNTMTYNEYKGIYNLDGTVDVEQRLEITSSGSLFQDFDNSGFVYSPYMSLAPNNGDNPSPQMLRGLGITGSLGVTNIVGTGSLFLQPNQGDARFVEIYNTSPTDTHITASGGQLFMGDDVTYVKVDNYGSVKRIDVVADNGVYISSSLNVSGSTTIQGNTTITGSLLVSGSASTDLTVQGRILISGGSTGGQTPTLTIQGSDNGFTSIGRGANNINTTLVNGVLDASGQIFANTSSVAGMYVGVYDDPNFNTDVELNIVVTQNGGTLSDWDNSNGIGVPFMTLAPNTGNNPTPQFTRGIGVTGSLTVSGNVMFASGSNKTMGTVALNGGNPGTATVSNSLVTTNSLIFLTKQTNNHPNAGPVVVSSKGTGTFTITSNHNSDTDVVAYQIINPA